MRWGEFRVLILDYLCQLRAVSRGACLTSLIYFLESTNIHFSNDVKIKIKFIIESFLFFLMLTFLRVFSSKTWTEIYLYINSKFWNLSVCNTRLAVLALISCVWSDFLCFSIIQRKFIGEKKTVSIYDHKNSTFNVRL